jgi:hypothetical protein
MPAYFSAGEDRRRAPEGCFSRGAPIDWVILGSFVVPSDAVGHTDRWYEAVRRRAMEAGCPAVAIRRESEGSPLTANTIGALCVQLDPRADASVDDMPTPRACESDSQCGKGGRCVEGMCG